MLPSPHPPVRPLGARAWRIRSCSLALVGAAAALAFLCASARASSPIEAVWAFNGGQVAIVEQPDGSYAGIVDAPTTFASCPHADGEDMWTDIREQPDGSYWGLHQWFFETPACVKNPTRGPTAWRVMTARAALAT